MRNPVIIAFLLFVASLQGATYYIDFNAANDSANGTSTSTPWKRCPGMQGFAGSYVHANGDRFIFKGGVTWPSSALPLDIPTNQGVLGNRDYYGVDTGWFTGGSWTKPIFDGEYADSYLINIGSRAHIDFDRLELKRVTSSAKDGYGLIIGNQPSQITITGCYLHGWRTTNNADGAHGGLIMTNYGPAVETLVFIGGEIENSENPGVSSSGGNGVMVRMWGTLKNSSFHHNSSGVLFCLDFDNCDIYNISGAAFDFYLGNKSYHTNGVYLDALTLNKTVAYIRNSRFRDCGGGANMAYLNGRFATIYCYNNVFWGEISDQRAIEIDPFDYGANTTSGTYYVFNNTGFLEPSTPLVHVGNRGGAPRPAAIHIRNNHAIGTSVSIDDNGPSAAYFRSNNLVQTAAVASGQGYVQGNIWAPTAIGNATVNTGISGSGTLPTLVDNDGTVRPQGAAWDIGAHEFVETPSAGTVQFSAANYDVAENGTSVTFTATRTGGSAGAIGVSYATSNITATAGADYTSTSGTLSWANAVTTSQTFVVTITDDGTFEGNEAFLATLSLPTGGAVLGPQTTATGTIIENDTPVIPTMGSNPWEAEDGLTETPITESGNIISQAVQTTVPGDGGRARYIFDVPSTGDYTMQMMVNAPDDSSNSIFIDWDSEPTSPTTIWDVIQTTTGVQERAVSWRGTGTFDTPQFAVKTWTLTAGEHTLYIRGREAGMQIDSIELVSLDPTDTTAPTPNPSTWSVVPFSLGPSDISMMATTASDPSIPVMYEFDETSGNPGGSDSGPQTNAFYTDSGLTPGTQYTYRVRVIDSAPTPNATTYSSSQSATTAVLPTSSVGTVNAGTLITH